MKKFAAVLTMLCIGFSLSAQTSKTIKGIVLDDSTGKAVPHASIVVVGTKIGAEADDKGNFSINLPPNSKASQLKVSSISYLTKVVSIDNSFVTIKLSAQPVAAEDVVVIGYQTVSKKDLRASVSSVGAKDLKDIPVNSAAEALNGRLAGVTATTAEGSPDAPVTIKVRAGTSITGDNSPLYIVDGVQVENALNTIAVQDIQSIDVLKDAAASAIYGARGANGVIIITTKNAKRGKMKVSYNGFVGIKKLAKELKVLSPYDFVINEFERSRNNTQDSTDFATDFGTTWDTLKVYKNVSPIDWQKVALGNTGVTQTHSLSVSGGGRKMTYLFGYTHNDDKAIVLNSKYKRDLISIKIDQNLTDKIKFNVTGRYINQNVYGAGTSDAKGDSYNRLRNAVKYRPFVNNGASLSSADPFADQGTGNGLSLINPLVLANNEYRQKTTWGYTLSGNVSYAIVKNLTFRSTFGFDYKQLYDRQFSDSMTPYSVIQGAAQPIVELDSTKTTTFNNSNVFTYSVKNYKNKHNFDFLIGEETYEKTTDLRSSIYKLFPHQISHDAAFNNLSLGVPLSSVYPSHNKYRETSLSFFGRINYSLYDKYLFSFNARSDGSSKFAPEHKWSFFPSGSFAWRVSKEGFMKNVSFINDLKFRAGYGEVGNNRIDDYLYQTTFMNNQYYYGLGNTSYNGYFQSALANYNLVWESTVSRNIGMDVTFLNNRINLSVDYYHNSSKNLLLKSPIASTYGVATQFQNAGKTANRGVEFQLGATIIKKKDFSWNSNFNISFNRNKIEELSKGQTQFFPDAKSSWGVAGQPTDYIVKVGDQVGEVYGLVADGFYKVSDFDYNPSNGAYTLKAGVVNDGAIVGVGANPQPQPGSIKFKNLHGGGKVSLDSDRTVIGHTQPKFTGGWNNQFSYKNWDLSIFVNFSYGNDVYNANKIEFTNDYIKRSNLLDIMNGRWKTVDGNGTVVQRANQTTGVVTGIAPDQLAALNANATIWQPLSATSAGSFYPSSFAIEDGSFLRINNITLGYSMSTKALKRIKISKVRFYATANNVAILTHYSGYDPEVSVRTNVLTPGLDYSAYPKSRTYIFGVNVSF